MTPLDTLTAALATLSEQGHEWPCATDPDAWYADDRHTRALAAALCHACPALAACAAYAAAADEQHGVWAGVDRTRPARGRQRTAAA